MPGGAGRVAEEPARCLEERAPCLEEQVGSQEAPGASLKDGVACPEERIGYHEVRVAWCGTWRVAVESAMSMEEMVEWV
jgi:hypothetical protein